MRVHRVLFLVAIAMLMWSSSSFAGDKRQTVVWTEAISTPADFPSIVLADCGDFQVLEDWAGIVRWIVHLNPRGKVADLQTHMNLLESWVYNSEHPEIVVPGMPGSGQRDRYDYEEGLVYITINMGVKVPGEGMLNHTTGYVVIDLITGEFVFRSGLDPLSDGDTAALCEAFAP